jgi:hypothetical protein
MQSPFVGRLLNGILRRGEGDVQALNHIARAVVEAPDAGFLRVDVQGRDLFPLTKQDMFRFLRASGFEVWHASTWLKVSEDGSVDTDEEEPFTAFQGGPEADARLGALVSTLWRTYSAGAEPVLVGGAELQVFSLPRLGALLDAARDIARRNPDWTASTIQQTMRSSMSAARGDSDSNDSRPASRPGRRPQ